MARIHLGPIERALVVENPDRTLDAALAAHGIHVQRVAETPDEERLIHLLRESRAQVLFKRSKVVVSRRVVEQAPDLLAVQLCCIGDDSVDKQATADHGLLVFNDPISNGRSVVELAVGHLVALSRRLYETDLATRAGGWDKGTAERFEVHGKVLGVLGLGNIGRGVARAAEQLGMRIRHFDSRQVSMELGAELGWQPAASLVDLFRGSDAVTVHLSARDIHGHSNQGVLPLEVLQQLGADRPEPSPRLFLNLSRGFLHSAEDLLAAVASGAIRRAAVDVYPHEPGDGDVWLNPYRDQPRIAVTPHIGASTLDAQPRIASRVAQTVGAWSHFGSVRDCVYDPRLRLSLVDDGREGRALLSVVHGTTRGTKRAIDDAIYQAGASNLASAHKDFEELGVACDLAALDRPLDRPALEGLVEAARAATGDESAIRAIRQVVLPS